MTPEQYLAKLFESDEMSDEEFYKTFPTYGEWGVPLPALELHWSPLSWVWRMRKDPPDWVTTSAGQRENWDETLEFLQRLHDKYMRARKR